MLVDDRQMSAVKESNCVLNYWILFTFGEQLCATVCDGIGEQPCAIENRMKSTGYSMIQKYKMHSYVRNCAEVYLDTVND